MHCYKQVFSALLIFFLAIGCTSVMAQDEGSAPQGHSAVPAMPHYHLDNAINTDFDSFEFQLSNEKSKAIEGRSWSLNYSVEPEARLASPLEISRNYGNQFKLHGGRVVFEQVSSGGGTVTMVMPLGTGERWLQAEINNNGEAYQLHIIETAEMKQKIEFSAEQMAEQIAASGKVTLYGILFDTGKSSIRPESGPVLDEVAAMMKKNVQLKIRVDGHTDNVGTKPANLVLSRARAAAVREALLSRGIAATRLTSEGYGDGKPVSDNNTEVGRALNRRVELTKQ